MTRHIKKPPSGEREREKVRTEAINKEQSKDWYSSRIRTLWPGMELMDREFLCPLCFVNRFPSDILLRCHIFSLRPYSLPSAGDKQEEMILNDPAAMYRFNDVVLVILSGLFGGL